MARQLKQSTRIHIYGGDKNEMRAYALITFDEFDNDSCVILVRGKEEDIPKLLKRYGYFTEEDIKKVLELELRCTICFDKYSRVIRLS